MKISLPWWHRALKPWFNFLADWRERREAARRLHEERTTRWKCVGYFIWKNKHVAAALVSNRGARRLEWLKGGIEVIEGVVVLAWLRGYPGCESHLWSSPYIPREQMDIILEREKKEGDHEEEDE